MSETVALETIYQPVEKRLARIPDAIFSILSTPNELAQETLRHFFSRQGKYLRPALTFFGAAMDSQDFLPPAQEEKLLRLAAAFEVFHSATLIHDDIIDSAHLRRNIPTINAKWNAQVAVLVGDYLHDKAIGAIFSAENLRVTSLFLQTAGTVCDGEIHELREKNNFDLKEEEYFAIIGKKTAALIACCLEAGGIFAGLAPEKTAALKRFGWAFGLAFQIVDDYLDFTGQEHEFGKTLGADCEAGVLTLPLIRLIQLEGRTQNEIFKPGRFEELKSLLEETGALDYALSRAKQFTDEARLELSVFGESAVKSSLERLLDYVLERNR